MVKLEQAIVAKYVHAGVHFEILVDPDLALKMKKGLVVSLDDLLATDDVYEDAKKSERQTESQILKVFGTLDIREIAPKIIREGEIQLTTEQRRQLKEEKRKAIIDFIAKNAMNPQTQAPHPPLRIETALNELKIQVDEFKDIPTQVNDILPKLRKLLPISMDKIQVAVKVPVQYVTQALSVLHKFELKKQEWQSDGSLIAVVEIPGGMKQELFEKLNHATHGDVVTKIMENGSEK
ncbi:MAG: ribosome assembly factor SBDS [Candidatus Diapherotrites archaeon]|uniref:Ribosome assembly factor SBDS n=1 Tax=Candidatus Iainarchaeum sp. TaxID=3101447 RepID=A0A8T4C7C3_9ARCH|nr:ribosome assembly factor SBDS [Candidatus Diapherotrites archaeon]